MRIAIVKGYVTSTIKHNSLNGWRLILTQPVSSTEEIDGPPQIVIDNLGAAIGQKVLLSSDGSESRKIVGDDRSPARWNVLGIIDPEATLHV